MAKDMARGVPEFGGNHTVDKLERVRQYLEWFTTTMTNKPFQSMYIDGFAGSGSYIPTRRGTKTAGESFFPRQEAHERDGSARIALRVKPRFDKYIFIDKNPKHIARLQLLRKKCPHHNIRIVNEDANIYLKTLCEEFDWTRWRAVLFLDPYGIQVEWATIKAVARTRAIDLWCLFPAGAVNRQLPRDGQIDDKAARRLDRVFGSNEWYDAFYKTYTRQHLLGEDSKIVKVVGPNQIGEYYLSRLRSVFVGAARRPRRLYSRSTLLFWLCFAAGDTKCELAKVEIAAQILAAPQIRRGP
jgi:three-Cys-motif partner protein